MQCVFGSLVGDYVSICCLFHLRERYSLYVMHGWLHKQLILYALLKQLRYYDISYILVFLAISCHRPNYFSNYQKH